MDNLISCLNIMKFSESEYEMKLTDNIFKTANKDLFRRIVCFNLSQFSGDFDDILGKYKSPRLPAKLENQFRMSLKDIVSKINTLYPGEFYLKPINQSHLIAPQGAKIIDFLSSFTKIALSVKLKRAGYSFVPPKNLEEYEKFMCENNSGDFENLDSRIEKAEAELKLAVSEHASATNGLNSYLKQCPFSDLRDESDLNILRTKLESMNNQLCKDLKDEVSSYKQVLDHLDGIIENFSKIKNSQDVCIDGLQILNDLGFKSNITAKISDVELVENGKLNLNSLINVTRSKCDVVLKYIQEGSFSGMNETINEFNTGIAEMDDMNKSLELNLKKLDDFIETFTPIVKKLQEEAVLKIQQSEDPLDKRLAEYMEFEEFANEEEPVDENSPLKLPVPEEDLTKWILGDKAFVKEDSPKNVNSQSILKSSRLLSLSKKKLSKLALRRKMVLKDQPGISKGYLLRGLCDDRRTTLASPSARKELFKIKRFEQKQKTFIPLPAKALFSSSPLGYHSVAKSSSSTALDLSPVINSSSIQDGNICSNSLAQACGFNLNRSFSEPSLNLTAELLKWEDKSSESDLDDSEPFPATSNKVSSPAQLDDSVELLIAQFHNVKAKLNLSN